MHRRSLKPAFLALITMLLLVLSAGRSERPRQRESPLPMPAGTKDAGGAVASEGYSPLPTPTGAGDIVRQGDLLLQGDFDRRAETSQYMTGSVRVMVFLPESDGSVDPSTEDWTEASIARVAAEVDEAMTRYETLAPAGADLSFEIAYRVVPTSYEPITWDWEGSTNWRWEVIHQFKPSFLEKEYAEWLRAEHGTDWAFILYIVNSESDADGAFPNGWTGWAYLNGPFAVCTSTDGTMGTSWLDSCVMHETGHIFGALDQRDSSCWGMGGWNGDVPNLNSLGGVCPGQVDLPSIMKWPAQKVIDPYMAGQIGWWKFGLRLYLPVVYKDQP
jgi:hypothetical protein